MEKINILEWLGIEIATAKMFVVFWEKYGFTEKMTLEKWNSHYSIFKGSEKVT